MRLRRSTRYQYIRQELAELDSLVLDFKHKHPKLSKREFEDYLRTIEQVLKVLRRYNNAEVIDK